MPIHPTAIIDTQAEIDSTADIGPYVTIEGPVKIGPHTRVFPNAFITGWTEIGARCQIHPSVVLGHVPQDFHYGGERSYCKIGDGAIIREFSSVHRGTQPESWTIIGNDCFMLANSHVAHNCILGNGVKVYNNTALAGHVEVGDFAIISASSMVHQFCRIGAFVMVAGGTRVLKDVPPCFMAAGENECVGVNSIGLRRSGKFSDAERLEVRDAYRVLYRSGMLFTKAIEALAAQVTTDAGRAILEFVRNPSRRGIIGPPKGGHAGDGDADES